MKGTSTLRKWPQLSFLQCRNIDFVSIQAKLGALGGVAVTTLKSACLNEYRYLKVWPSQVLFLPTLRFRQCCRLSVISVEQVVAKMIAGLCFFFE